MISSLKFPFLFAITQLGLKLIFSYLNSKADKKKLTVDFKNIIFEFVIVFVTIFIITYVAELIFLKYHSSNWTIPLIIVFTQISIYSSYYILLPIYCQLKSKNTFRDKKIETYIVEKYAKKYKVITSDHANLNAFATGILPFSKTIIISKDLLAKIKENEFEAIISHEVAHLKLNHLVKLLFLQITVACIVMLSWNFISPNLSGYILYPLYLSLYYGIFLGLGSLFILGLFQKKYEKEADTFAAKNTSPEAVIDLLNTLNIESKGALEKWSWNYPTLKERIENVS